MLFLCFQESIVEVNKGDDLVFFTPIGLPTTEIKIIFQPFEEDDIITFSPIEVMACKQPRKYIQSCKCKYLYIV